MLIAAFMYMPKGWLSTDKQPHKLQENTNLESLWVFENYMTQMKMEIHVLSLLKVSIVSNKIITYLI